MNDEDGTLVRAMSFLRTPAQNSTEDIKQAGNTDNGSLPDTTSTLDHTAKDSNKGDSDKEVEQIVVSHSLLYSERLEDTH